MKFSIVMPVWNNVDLTTAAIRSVQKHTKDFELLVINNGSTDGTGHFLESLSAEIPDLKVCTFGENMGFAVACNHGMKAARGDFIILLNNDTDVTEGWADYLVKSIPLAEDEWDARPIGIIGPVSNNAGGNQRVQVDQYGPEELQVAAAERHKTHAGKTRLAGFVSGFCMLITRQCFDEVGLLDERFKVGGVEDTEYCIRAQRAGWKLAISDETFVHHHGQQTINTLGDSYGPIHRANQFSLMEKYCEEGDKKLIATFRVRDQPEFLRKSLARAAEFCDGIIVLCDRCNEETIAIAREADKVLEVETLNLGWDLYRDRAAMMQLAKKYDPDWIIALDADEFLEDSFTRDVAQRLMHPLDPNVNAYSFPFATFFLGRTHFRTDGVFGRMRGLRMYRSLPNQNPRMVRHSHRTCLHCPSIPPFNVRNLRYRVKHYGYESQAICDQKFRFYTKLDPHPDKGYIGPEGYEHLRAETLTVQRFTEKNDLALCMIVKNEEVGLFGFLFRYHAFFDQIVIVDTGSNDRTRKIAEIFGAEVHRIPALRSFAEARNFAKSKCSCRWMMTCDPDEELDVHHFTQIYQMLDAPVHAWLFKIVNFKPDGTVFYSDNVRLVRNIPGVYWTHRVHENITESVQENKLKVEMAPFSIKHYGYLKHSEVGARKAKLYNRLLKKDLREAPECAITHFHAAFMHFEKKHLERGMKSLEHALKLQPDLFIASKELGLRRLDEAVNYLQQAKDTTPANHYFRPWADRIVRTLNTALQTPVD